jgi:glucokinase
MAFRMHIQCRGIVSKRAIIGIDVGGTKVMIGLFDEEFQVIEEIKKKTPQDEQEFASLITESCEELNKAAAGKSLKLATVGIGFSGKITEKGVVETAANIPAVVGFSFKKALAALDVPILAHNDVNAALYGEHKFGAAQGCKHAIGVFIGTGIGGAILINGKLYHGATGDAGDIGNYLLQPFGPLAGSARHGVLDDVASRTAIAADAAALAIKQWAPSLLENAGTDLRNIKSSALAQAIEGGDKAIEELVRSRAQIVGIVLSNFVDFLNPEMVVLGGGLTEALPEIIRDEVAAGIEGHASPTARKKVKVVIAKLMGHAVTIGAAKLALDALDT